MLIEYKNQKIWLENYKGVEQINRTVGRPFDREKPESSVNSVGRQVGRSISTVVDRLVDRAQITWACACLVHVGRPLGRRAQPSVDRLVDRKQPKNSFNNFLKYILNSIKSP